MMTPKDKAIELTQSFQLLSIFTGYVLGVFFLLIILPSVVQAIPQYAVESSVSCDNCHSQPAGWNNPKTSLRKCTLDCTACHVNPTGAGMRTVAGTFYGRQVLPQFGSRPGGAELKKGHDNPMVGDSSKAPNPLSKERYGGLTPYPMFQVGFDFRSMAYFPQSESRDVSFFPMQADLYLAFRPYNPRTTNNGRVTLLVNGGFKGDRERKYEDLGDRAFVREWWLLLNDLPYQFYMKAGRFLPAFGWRLADHTSYVRENQTFDHDRQVTGVEFGINPNYPYFNISLFNSSPNWDNVYDPDAGYGAAINGGYRTFLGQLGGSVLYESNDLRDQTFAGIQWALNLKEAAHPWKPFAFLPLTYLGELDFWRRDFKNNVEHVIWLSTMHQLRYYVTRGVSVILQYDWQDHNIEIKNDHHDQFTVGVEYVPFKHTSFQAYYRFKDEPQHYSDDEAFLQMHLWY